MAIKIYIYIYIYVRRNEFYYLTHLHGYNSLMSFLINLRNYYFSFIKMNVSFQDGDLFLLVTLIICVPIPYRCRLLSYKKSNF